MQVFSAAKKIFSSDELKKKQQKNKNILTRAFQEEASLISERHKNPTFSVMRERAKNLDNKKQLNNTKMPFYAHSMRTDRSKKNSQLKLQLVQFCHPEFRISIAAVIHSACAELASEP